MTHEHSDVAGGPGGGEAGAHWAGSAPRREHTQAGARRGGGRAGMGEDGRVLTIATANVNGIRAACRRGMGVWIDERKPDVLLLQ